MHNYCTLFDSNYLDRGLALYKSLCDVKDIFHLFVVAFDDECYEVLNKLHLENLTVVSLIEFESKELLAVKSSRSRAEYCWTCGSSIIYYFISNYKLDHCTYLDADLMFFSSPDPIYDEIGNNSIAITEHFTDGELEGQFCVQFVYFKNDMDGMKALIWWKNSCIEWCYARYEDGKFGDQKYLDYFPTLFKNVHIIKHRGAGVAPWNVLLYSLTEYGEIEFNKQLFDIIFFHYHGSKIDLLENSLRIKVFTSDVTTNVEKFIYLPYLRLLQSIYKIYFEKDIISIRIEKRSFLKKIYFIVKNILRYNSFVRFVYYKTFKVK